MVPNNYSRLEDVWKKISQGWGGGIGGGGRAGGYSVTESIWMGTYFVVLL